jgi:hypothetical protein
MIRSLGFSGAGSGIAGLATLAQRSAIRKSPRLSRTQKPQLIAKAETKVIPK